MLFFFLQTTAHFSPLCIDLVNCSYSPPTPPPEFLPRPHVHTLDAVACHIYHILLASNVAASLCRQTTPHFQRPPTPDWTIFEPRCRAERVAFPGARPLGSAAADIVPPLPTASPVCRIRRLEAAAARMHGDPLCMRPLISIAKQETERDGENQSKSISSAEKKMFWFPSKRLLFCRPAEHYNKEHRNVAQRDAHCRVSLPFLPP